MTFLTLTGMGGLRPRQPAPAQLPGAQDNAAAAVAPAQAQPNRTWRQRLTSWLSGSEEGPSISARTLRHRQTYDYVAPGPNGLVLLNDLINTYNIQDFSRVETASLFQVPELFPARPSSISYLRAWAQNPRRRVLAFNGMSSDGRTASVHLLVNQLRDGGVNTHIFTLDDSNFAGVSSEERSRRVVEFFGKFDRFVAAQRAVTPDYQAILYVRNSRTLFGGERGEGVESRRALRDGLIARVGDGAVRVILEGTEDLFGSMRNAFGNDRIEEFQLPSPSEEEIVAILRVHARRYENLITGRVAFTNDALNMILSLAPAPQGGVGARARLSVALSLLEQTYQHLMDVGNGLNENLSRLNNRVSVIREELRQRQNDGQVLSASSSAASNTQRNQEIAALKARLGISYENFVKTYIETSDLNALPADERSRVLSARKRYLFGQVSPVLNDADALAKAKQVVPAGAQDFGMETLYGLRRAQVERFLDLHRDVTDEEIGTSVWEQLFNDPARAVDADLFRNILASQSVALGPKGMLIATPPTVRHVAPRLRLNLGREGSLLDEMERLKTHIKNNIAGQEDPIEQMMDLHLRQNSDLRSAARPVKFFRGPPGVGKTRLAEVYAQGAGIGFYLIECEKLGQAHEVSRLTGAPPGYRGNDQDALLVQALRSFQSTGGRGVILLDEIEKAHADIYQALLNVLNTGIFTDQHGVKHDFSKVTFLFASNIGSMELAQYNQANQKRQELLEKLEHVYGYATPDTMHQQIQARVAELTASQTFEQEYIDLSEFLTTTPNEGRKFLDEANRKFETKFTPEFRSRVGEPLTFSSLSNSQLREVLSMRLAKAKVDARELGFELQIGADNLTPEARAAEETAILNAVVAQSDNTILGVRELIRNFEGSLLDVVRVVSLEADHVIRNSETLSVLPETQAELLRGTKLRFNLTTVSATDFSPVAAGAEGLAALRVDIDLNSCQVAMGDGSAAIHRESTVVLGDIGHSQGMIRSFRSNVSRAGSQSAAQTAQSAAPAPEPVPEPAASGPGE